MKHADRTPIADLPAPTSATSLSTAVRVRVRYCECDPMNVAHHAAFIPWLELARTELLRTSGVSYAHLEAAGVFLVVVRLDCRYKLPARYDDVLEIRVRVSRATRVKIEHEYDIFRISGEVNPATLAGGTATDLLMSATTTLGCVDAHAKIRELPAWLASIDPASHS